MATSSAKNAARKPKPAPPQEVVDPRWLLKALAIIIAASLMLAYISLCGLIYQGAWQLMLHPSAKVDATPAVPFEPVRFDASENGTPRLTGWWIPGDPGDPRTILYLHDGSGSISSAVPRLNLLHQTGVSILIFDYRGFGQSDPPHPTESRMGEDATAALDYLQNTRHVATSQIIPYGEGLGGVLAAKLANHTDALPAVILDTPDPDAFQRATTSRQSRFIPMQLIETEKFNLTSPLQSLHKPALLLADGPFGSDAARTATNQALFRTVAAQKIVVTFDNAASGTAYIQSVSRFLDEYLPPTTVPLLK